MFARTKRLFLRPGWPEDAPALTRAIAHEAVVRRLAHVPWPYRQEDAERFLASPRDPGDVAMLIVAHESGRADLVGALALERVFGAHRFGYWLTPAAWGRGYATEAGEAMIGIARHALGCGRLVAHAHADNVSSQRVLAKLGFAATGEAALHSRAHDGKVASVSFALDLRGRAFA